MPFLKIDGKEIEVKKGTTIIEASKLLGIEIPHFCYHPGLKPAGTCRMCLVEIAGNPKLQTACTTEVQDGMVVNTSSPAVLKAREEVLEFLLYDHPLDCPICDKAGECLLQKNYNEHGKPLIHIKENQIRKEKKITISEKLILDRERCVLCTRCVRFLEEVIGTRELLVSKRGDDSEIDIFNGYKINNLYSGNLVDICPVGAIGDLTFRFKTRVWFLKEIPHICPLCARGCNIYIDVKGEHFPSFTRERILRVRPRFSEINKYWICDIGRYKLEKLDMERISNPTLIESNGLREVSIEEALLTFSHFLKEPEKIAVVASYYLTNEENYLIKDIFFNKMGIKNIGYSGVSYGEGDNILLLPDKNPNREGVRRLWGDEIEEVSERILELIRKRVFSLVLLIGDEVIDGREDVIDSIKGVFTVWILSRKNNAFNHARVIIPKRNIFEMEGSFTNFKGITQKFPRALPPVKGALNLKEIILQIASVVGLRLEKDFERKFQ
ncbi:MAG: 2Fe-2S iron-sulfur cluster-binding protein [Candidatus Aminicenantia bacterium]